MKPTTSKAIQDHIMISPKLITDMESCLRQLTTTTNRANYVNDLIKANHRKQQSIQRRYHAISNEHMSELGQTIKPLMEEQGRVCDENELLMNMVNDMEFRLKACETLITSVGHQFTSQLREKPTTNTLKRSLDKKSITKTRNTTACYFCAKPRHTSKQCNNANEAHKNFISYLLNAGEFDFEKFKIRVAEQEELVDEE